MSASNDPVPVLSEVFSLLSGSLSTAQRLLETELPFEPIKSTPRRYTKKQLITLWQRDSYRDRYSNKRLIYPGALRLLSHLFPEQFPYHTNWKFEFSHPLYWEIYPTLDHLYPVSRGGIDQEANWVTTSMVRNAAKSNFTLDEMQWTLYDVENDDWDGLSGEFIQFVDQDQNLASTTGVKEWYTLLKNAT